MSCQQSNPPSPVDTDTSTGPPTPTPTATPTVTETATASSTETASTTPSVTATSTATATETVAPTRTATATETDQPTATATATATATTTETATPTATATATQTATLTATATYPAVDLKTFCTGGAARMIVNGIESNPTVKGKVVPCTGCKGAEFQISTPTFAEPLAVSWQAQGTAFSGVSSLDLSKLPTGWTVGLETGCASTVGCTTSSDSYAAGFVGSLALSIGKSALYDMSLCLHVQEPVDGPHLVVHMLDLFIPRAGAN